ncbi:hypothetical protein J6TS1_21850 [Siminovitchia terrae]|uniref:Uncharacterized protein n=1 Tax=Siminovitchia terrae TaxID=1914933 RepID=A0ABQ4KXR2_SIMTE|nr:hypothetical protein [Siminovitchia terrae]GIN96315.1 hypothetical protein J6TS1_21850 [Siminovitchia terrae]
MEQFLPIIIIALISFFVNKASEQKKRATNQEKPKGPNSRPVQPRQQERPVSPANQKPIHEKPQPVRVERPRSLKEAAEILLSQMQPQIEEKKAEAEDKMEELKKEAAAYKEKAIEMQRKVEAVKETKPAGPQIEPFFQQNDIVKGIIMSEVLGPPRAKKRYGRH